MILHVKGSGSHDYVWKNSALSGLWVTRVSIGQWFLMYANVDKLICYSYKELEVVH